MRIVIASIVSVVVISTVTISANRLAQRTADVPRASGGGELSPRVVATWEGHSEPQSQNPDGPMTLDLLVLWRGGKGWLEMAPTQGGANQPLSAGPGYPERIHQVWVRGRKLSLIADSKTNTAVIQGREIPLNGVNVLMIDNVDQASVDVTTAWVDPKIQGPLDPHALVKQYPVLRDFVRSR